MGGERNGCVGRTRDAQRSAAAHLRNGAPPKGVRPSESAARRLAGGRGLSRRSRAPLSDAQPGHDSAVGVPTRRKMRSSCSGSDWPGSSGRFVTNSPKMQPTDLAVWGEAVHEEEERGGGERGAPPPHHMSSGGP